MANICEQLDFTDTMEPIIKVYQTELETKFTNGILKACRRVEVDVDKERLLQALNDARKFYDEGYRAGYGEGYNEGLMVALGRGYGPMRERWEVT